MPGISMHISSRPRQGHRVYFWMRPTPGFHAADAMCVRARGGFLLNERKPCFRCKKASGCDVTSTIGVSFALK